MMILVPNFHTLGSWLAVKHLPPGSPDELVTTPAVREKIEREARKSLRDLAQFETPKKFLILSRDFSIESGELTPDDEGETARGRGPLPRARSKRSTPSRLNHRDPAAGCQQPGAQVGRWRSLPHQVSRGQDRGQCRRQPFARIQPHHRATQRVRLDGPGAARDDAHLAAVDQVRWWIDRDDTDTAGGGAPVPWRSTPPGRPAPPTRRDRRSRASRVPRRRQKAGHRRVADRRRSPRDRHPTRCSSRSTDSPDAPPSRACPPSGRATAGQGSPRDDRQDSAGDRSTR